MTIPIATDPAYHRLFDAAAWVAGLVGGYAVSRWRLKDNAITVPARTFYLIALAIGAILGAYCAGSRVDVLSGKAALSHSVAGALAGAIAAVEIYKALNGIRGSTGTVFVVPFTVGIIVGRWGCLFAGLPDHTFGVPAALLWAVDLGDGIARHPVQIYESLSMLVFLGVYLFALQRRAAWALGRGFYVMVMWYGAQRFIWEFLKPYPKLAGPFNLFHLICIGLFAYGCLYFSRTRNRGIAS